MTLEQSLKDRANNRCELCANSDSLAAYDVTPYPAEQKETQILICKECQDHLGQPKSVAINHWYGLNESVWSEHAAVKVAAYRILKKLDDQAWAQDLLSQMYLDDELQSWADAGLSQSVEEGKAQVVDSNGTVLQDGDTVTLIKDLDVKGANFTAKRGTTVKNIVLTDDPKYIEGRVNGTRIVLVAAYLKKA